MIENHESLASLAFLLPKIKRATAPRGQQIGPPLGSSIHTSNFTSWRGTQWRKNNVFRNLILVIQADFRLFLQKFTLYLFIMFGSNTRYHKLDWEKMDAKRFFKRAYFRVFCGLCFFMIAMGIITNFTPI